MQSGFEILKSQCANEQFLESQKIELYGRCQMEITTDERHSNKKFVHKDAIFNLGIDI